MGINEDNDGNDKCSARPQYRSRDSKQHQRQHRVISEKTCGPNYLLDKKETEVEGQRRVNISGECFANRYLILPPSMTEDVLWLLFT